jgi:hypothetical protein
MFARTLSVDDAARTRPDLREKCMAGISGNASPILAGLFFGHDQRASPTIVLCRSAAVWNGCCAKGRRFEAFDWTVAHVERSHLRAPFQPLKAPETVVAQIEYGLAAQGSIDTRRRILIAIKSLRRNFGSFSQNRVLWQIRNFSIFVYVLRQ